MCIDPWLLFDAPDRFRNLRISIRAIYPLIFITPGHPKAQVVGERAVEKDPWQLKDVPDHFKMEKMCESAAEKNPWCLKYVPDHFKAEKMCKKAVEDDPYTLEFVRDHFKSLGMNKWLRKELTYCSMFLIGLLQGRGYICGMMTVNIVMMIIFVSGAMVIKNKRFKKPQ